MTLPGQKRSGAPAVTTEGGAGYAPPSNPALFFGQLGKYPIDVALAFLRWLREELLRELLWGAWQHVLNRTGAAQDAAFVRFDALVAATDCSPFFVEYCHPRAMAERARRGLACQPCLLILGAEAAAEPSCWEEDLA